jgi:hypothetical protein
MDAQHIHALNQLLEDERASVEILIALTSMATDSLERQALTVMGGQAAQACGDLREVLAGQNADISRKVSAAAARVVAPEHLDERFYAYAELQRQMAERITSLAQAELDRDAPAMLATLRAMHLAHAAWVTQRADEFVASRRQAEEAAGLAHPAGREAAPEDAASDGDAAAPAPVSTPEMPAEPEDAREPRATNQEAAPDAVPADSDVPADPMTVAPALEQTEPDAPSAGTRIADDGGAYQEPSAPRARRSRTRLLEDAAAVREEE